MSASVFPPFPQKARKGWGNVQRRVGGQRERDGEGWVCVSRDKEKTAVPVGAVGKVGIGAEMHGDAELGWVRVF